MSTLWSTAEYVLAAGVRGVAVSASFAAELNWSTDRQGCATVTGGQWDSPEPGKGGVRRVVEIGAKWLEKRVCVRPKMTVAWLASSVVAGRPGCVWQEGRGAIPH